MFRICFVAAVCCAICFSGTAWGSFVLLDNFESYNPGQLAPQSSLWSTSHSTLVQVGADPGNPDNQIVVLGPPASGTAWTRFNDGTMLVPDGNMGTLFFRIRVPDTAHSGIALSPRADASAWPHGQPILRVGDPGSHQNLYGRDAGTYQLLTNQTDPNTWYNVWMVVDNNARTAAYYLQSDYDAAFASQTLIGPPLGAANALKFRADEPYGNLVSILFTSDQGGGGNLYVDDIHIDRTAVNLASPIGPVATLGHWRFEPGAFLTDSSGNGHTLTPVGSPVPYALPASGPGSAFPAVIPQTHAVNEQAASLTTGNRFELQPGNSLNPLNFTIEALIHLEQAKAGTNSSSVIASRYHGTNDQRAWGFAVASTVGGGFGGKGPGAAQELFLSLSPNGTLAGLQAFGSDFIIDTGVDYYVAAAYTAPVAGDPGSITFYLQDLTNSGALLSHTVETSISVLQPTAGWFEIGALNRDGALNWEGLIDEVRFSGIALMRDQLLIVPEPGTWLLFVSTLCAGLLLRRRRAG